MLIWPIVCKQPKQIQGNKQYTHFNIEKCILNTLGYLYKRQGDWQMFITNDVIVMAYIAT